MRSRYSAAMRFTSFISYTVIASSCVTLVACGHATKINGNADEAWARTLQALHVQGVMPEQIESGLTRPRVDRIKGEIDLPYAASVYYGDGAAFIQVDVSDPLEVCNRSVRMWVDYPVGNNVVRFGRAIDERESDNFYRAFTKALATLPATAPTPIVLDEVQP